MTDESDYCGAKAFAHAGTGFVVIVCRRPKDHHQGTHRTTIQVDIDFAGTMKTVGATVEWYAAIEQVQSQELRSDKNCRDKLS